eukprot:TRINITY_DN86_c0_g3_i1.p1 TRINITY_DN86_c0_g3~~TRINITY_DN86_c0_g3_i1.p1  ORF type:complete len:537 (+),score=105.67 TRINITY_DN86_c0_g3_i1:37-1611(+)
MSTVPNADARCPNTAMPRRRSGCAAHLAAAAAVLCSAGAGARCTEQALPCDGGRGGGTCCSPHSDPPELCPGGGECCECGAGLEHCLCPATPAPTPAATPAPLPATPSPPGVPVCRLCSAASGSCCAAGGVCPSGKDCCGSQQGERYDCDSGCVANCAARGAECGGDGCGGTCGSCNGSAVCWQGRCVPPGDVCEPCPSNASHPYHCCPAGRSGSGGCPAGTHCCPYCHAGRRCLCTAHGCRPRCEDRECGDDGCGGDTGCGTCSPGYRCAAGRCVCAADCEGRQCGTDACGGGCGSGCPPSSACLADGQCAAPAPARVLRPSQLWAADWSAPGQRDAAPCALLQPARLPLYFVSQRRDGTRGALLVFSQPPGSTAPDPDWVYVSLSPSSPPAARGGRWWAAVGSCGGGNCTPCPAAEGGCPVRGFNGTGLPLTPGCPLASPPVALKYGDSGGRATFSAWLPVPRMPFAVLLGCATEGGASSAAAVNRSSIRPPLCFAPGEGAAAVELCADPLELVELRHQGAA